MAALAQMRSLRRAQFQRMSRRQSGGGAAHSTRCYKLATHICAADLVTSQAINWGNDPFARGAYSYATPKTREAQLALRKPDGGAVFFSGEALYAGRDMGTVEAALASGRETAQTILAAGG
jgi:monoamine oxidase